MNHFASILVVAVAISIGISLRFYLWRKHPESWIRPSIERVQDEGLKRALRWTLNFGTAAGLVPGFLFGMVVQRRFLPNIEADTREVIWGVGMLIWLALMILASHPPLGKYLNGSQSKARES